MMARLRESVRCSVLTLMVFASSQAAVRKEINTEENEVFEEVMLKVDVVVL